MSNTRLFAETVQAVIAPRLSNVGFTQRSALSYVRSTATVLQVVEFLPSAQRGGHFTVRLGIYVPGAPASTGQAIYEDEVGLGCCQVRASLGRLLCGQHQAWSTGLGVGESYRQMRDVLRGILIHGLGWLAHMSDESTLLRFFARASVRPVDPCKAPRLPPALVLGLLHQRRGDTHQARLWFLRALQHPGALHPGLLRWLADRLHALP